MREIERFSVRMTEAHSGARVVLKTSPDGSLVRYEDHLRVLRAAENHLLKELAERVRAELVREDPARIAFAGLLGESIENAGASLEFGTPEQVAEGICDWLSTLTEGADHE